MKQLITRRDILVNTLMVEFGLASLAIILAWALDFDLWSALRFTWPAVLWGCLGALPPLTIILLIDRYPIGPFRHVADISDQFLRPLLGPCKWPDYFLLSALAGFCEELFFRGWMQPCLAQWMPLWASILIGGFIFALCHLITPAYFIIAWIISLYLAGLLYWTDNLLVPMIAHGVYDLIAIFAVMSTSPAPPPVIWDSQDALPTLPREEPAPWPSEPSPSSTDKAPGNDE